MSPDSPNILAANHLQQAAEKILGAVRLHRGLLNTKDHDLVILIDGRPGGEPRPLPDADPWRDRFRPHRVTVGVCDGVSLQPHAGAEGRGAARDARDADDTPHPCTQGAARRIGPCPHELAPPRIAVVDEPPRPLARRRRPAARQRPHARRHPFARRRPQEGRLRLVLQECLQGARVDPGEPRRRRGVARLLDGDLRVPPADVVERHPHVPQRDRQRDGRVRPLRHIGPRGLHLGDALRQVCSVNTRRRGSWPSMPSLYGRPAPAVNCSTQREEPDRRPSRCPPDRTSVGRRNQVPRQLHER